MPETSIDWITTKAIVAELRADTALRGVSIEPGWVGEQGIVAEMIWLDETESNVAIPVMTGTRMHRDDLFDLTWLYRVAGRPTLDATRERIAQLMASIENVLANSPTLSDLDGVVSAEITRRRAMATRTPSGFVGFGETVVQVHSRLT